MTRRDNRSSLTGVLVSVALLMAGVGLLQSLVALRGEAERFSTVTIGVLMSGYFAGYLTGSTWATRLIARVGHVRAFAAFGSTASAAFLLHGLGVHPAVWLALRIVSGICVAGLIVAVESWLNRTSSNATRGTVLSWYMVVSFAGLGVGQIMLNVDEPGAIGLFALVSILVSLSIVPVALTHLATPDESAAGSMTIRAVIGASPVAFVAAVVTGLLHSAIVTLGALYASQAGLSRGQTSAFVASILLAGMASAIPLGHMSDRMDRRRLLAVLAFACGAACVPTLFVVADAGAAVVIATGAALGALTYPLYPLALAELNDRLAPDEILAAGAKLVLVYAVGAVAGPLAAAGLMASIGPEGFWWYQLVLHGVLFAFAAYRLTRLAPMEVRSPYSPLPSGATPAVVGLATGAPMAAENTRRISTTGVALAVGEMGEGPPVVLVHGLGTDRRIWQLLGRPLARSGRRVVTYDLRGHGESGRADRYLLRDHVADLDAVIKVVAGDGVAVDVVAEGFGCLVALGWASHRPGAPRTLALVACADVFAPDKAPARLLWRSTLAAEHAVDHLVDPHVLARRRARSHYDPDVHPDRYRLLYESALTSSTHATSAAIDAVAAARPPRPPGGVETIVVLGERDRSATPSQLEQIRRVLGSVEIVRIPESGAFPHLDEPQALHDVLAPRLGLERARVVQVPQ